MLSFLSMRGPARRLLPLSLLAALLPLAAACSGGGGSGGSAGASSTGSVGVLISDAPSSDFLQVLLEVTKVELLGDAGRAVLFDDPAGREFDLLSLRDDARMLALSRRVPAGDWNKIRLQIQGARLVRATPSADVQGDVIPCPEGVELDDPDLVCESIVPKTPGGGKLDLNPRGTIHVRAGELVLVKLDVDAVKSIHIVKTGAHAKYILRPVVFVDVFTRQATDRLVLLEGTIGTVDLAAGAFELCGGHAVFDASLGEPGGELAKDRCADVRVGAETSIFGPEGDALGLEDLVTGDPAAALGRFRLDGSESLRFDAETVQVGGRAAVTRVAGEVTAPVEDTGGLGEFVIAPDPDGPVQADELVVRLLDGAKLFDRAGEPLDPADLAVGQRVRAFGWLVPSDGTPERLDASVVFASGAETTAEPLRGVVATPFDPATGELVVNAELPAGVAPRCVAIGPGDDVFRLVEGEGMLHSERIGPGDLETGENVDVYGEDGAPCYAADTVISLGFSP